MLGWKRNFEVEKRDAGNAPEFRPLPLLGNAHVQTVLGAMLHVPVGSLASRERHVALDDGDRLVVHESVPAGWRSGDPLALLVHGLGGSHRSGYVQRMGRLLLARGLRVACLDLRGSGRGFSLARRPYHAGCSADVRAVAAALHHDLSPLFLIGFSLGGNIVLKLAGEAAREPLPGLARVAALAPPIELDLCSRLISLPRNRFYEKHFLHELVALALRRQRLFPDLPPVNFPRPLSLRLFDDLYTAPRSGFRDAADYYRRASALPLIPDITVPTLIMTARDDPFIPVAPFESLRPSDHILLRVVPAGGHLGFLGRDGAGGIRWAEQRVVDWLMLSL